MKTIKEVKTFFEHDLNAILNELEILRLGINNRYSFKHYRTTLKILGLLAVAAIIASMVAPNSPWKWGTMLVPFTAVVAIVHPVILWSLRASAFKSVNKKYKEEIVPHLLSFVHPRLTYFPKKGIARTVVESSWLFESADTRFRSEDLVEGSLQGFDVRFADVLISKYIRTASSSRRSRRVIIFSGVFFQIDLNRKLTSRTMVMPDIREGMGIKLAKKIFGDDAEQVLEKLGERIESFEHELIKMNDQRFEKYFSVYAQNEKEARTLLTPSLMQELADFREKGNHIIHLSFSNQHMNLAIDAPDMFESGVEESFLRFENFREYIEILLFMSSLLTELPTQPLVAVQPNSTV